ncbi:MAG TPA: hypothetical protein EYH31_05435 [Anaerolineae bacterium]|nr:hypothetical protein [Anaerolineae bacterium]
MDLYGQRDAFRPAEWSAQEFQRFVDAVIATGRPVYLLDDGVDLDETLHAARERFGLVSVAVLDVPVFGDADAVTRKLYLVGR